MANTDNPFAAFADGIKQVFDGIGHALQPQQPHIPSQPLHEVRSVAPVPLHTVARTPKADRSRLKAAMSAHVATAAQPVTLAKHEKDVWYMGGDGMLRIDFSPQPKSCTDEEKQFGLWGCKLDSEVPTAKHGKKPKVVAAAKKSSKPRVGTRVLPYAHTPTA